MNSSAPLFQHSPANGSAKTTTTVHSLQPESQTKVKASAVSAKKRSSKRKSEVKARAHKSRSKSFPNASFEDSLLIADTLQSAAAGNRMRRLTIFDQLKKAPDSGPSRQMVINSGRYGLTLGGYQAEHLELTPQGKIATDPDANSKDRIKERFTLAISGIPPFKLLYDKVAGNKLPTQAVMQDMLREAGYPEEELAECVDTFIVNAKFLGLLRTIAGAERVITLEHLLEEMPEGGVVQAEPYTPVARAGTRTTGVPLTAETTDWSKICFYISPIGEENSDQRRHSDLFLNFIVEPALLDTGLKIIRADQIGKPGMIGAQIVEHVIKSKLVIADLSYHNPNVFYELALRHACGLPTVQIIRACDKIPFDLQPLRTVPVDTTDIYSLVPKLEVLKSEIATHVRGALENPDSADNPITSFCPNLRVTFPGDNNGTNGKGK